MNKEFLTADELAELFDVKKQTVWRWVRQGKVPYFKVGGSLRFNTEDIRRHKLEGV
jgi:excisionase family DNA binding protein